jgi:phosphoglycerol transferase MdoB-like AlkP superfamily enzyme
MQAYFGLAYNQVTVIDPWLSAAVLFISGILAFGLSIYLFSWDSSNQTRRGSPLLALLVLLPYIAAILIGFVL